MAANITVITDRILEKTTPKITAVIKDETLTPIPASSLASLTLTFYSLSDAMKTVINSRDAQNVLNANNVTVDGSGNLTWQMVEGDTAILAAALNEEIHRAVFAWTYGSPTKTGRHVIDITIRNLEKVS